MEENRYKTAIVLQKLFSAYYNSRSSKYVHIPTIENREFAFMSWRRPGMFRHIGFMNESLLWDYLARNGPRNCYRSAAYYRIPEADTMDKKEYMYCDFVFDIDADHIPTPCRVKHNYYFCKECGYKAMGEKPRECPKCKNNKFDEIVWICDDCLNVAKEQVYRLIDDFLIPDFGMSLSDISIHFSGHRGYHVQIKSEKIRELDSEARRDIVDYLRGEGFSFKIWNFQMSRVGMSGFLLDQLGWPGKIARKLQEVLMLPENEIYDFFKYPLYEKGLPDNIITQLVANREEILETMKNGGRHWQIKGIGEKSWHQIFYILRDSIKADIDAVVSFDLHRLIRMEGSIHGKSGMLKRPIEYSMLDKFDPLSNAFPFPVNSPQTFDIVITSRLAPGIRIGSKFYGPFMEGEKVTLPLNAAVFYLCKNVALLDR